MDLIKKSDDEIIKIADPIWKNLVLDTTLKKPSGSVENQQSYKLLLGKHGKSVSELYPTGQIEIEGLRYDARSSLGKIAKGENVEVFKVSEFELVVKPLDS